MRQLFAWVWSFTALPCAALLPEPPPTQAPLPPIPSQIAVGPEATDDGHPAWNVTIPEQHVLHVRIEQLDTDLALELTDAAGHLLRRDDAIRQPFGHEELWWLNEATTTYRVRLIAERPGTARIKAFETRPAPPDERQRVRAEHLLASARQGYVDDPEAPARRLADAEAAREIFETLALDTRVCTSLRFAGQNLRHLGRLDEAEERQRRCVELARAAGLHAHLARAWLDLSAIAHSRGDFKSLLAAAQASLEAAERSSEARQIAEARSNIALALARLGRRREALPVQRSIVEDARRRQDRKDLAWGLVNLGANLYNLGDNDHAVTAFSEAHELLAALSYRREAALVLSNLATIYASLGDIDSARGHTARALAIRQELDDKPGQAASLVSLAKIYRLSYQPEPAESLYRRAIALYLSSANQHGEGFALAQLGAVLTELDRHEEAAEPLAQALAIARELGHRDTEAETLASLAEVAHRQADRQRTRELYTSMARVARQVEDPYRESEARYGLARLAAEHGERAVALTEIERAVELVESLRARAGAESLRASVLQLYRGYYDLWIDLLLDASGSDGTTASPEAAADAYAVVERARARGLLDLLAETRGVARLRLGTAADEVLELELKVRRVQRRLVAATGEEAENLRQQLGASLAELERARQTLRRAHPRFAEVFEPRPIDLPTARQLLAEDELLLEYHLGSERSWLFAVGRHRLAVFPLPDEAEITRLATELRQWIAEPRRRIEGRFYQASRKLADTLLRPATSLLAMHSKLIVVADGALRTLPFEALVGPEETTSRFTDMPFLVRSHEIAYAASASVLASLERLRADDPPAWQLDLLAFGDPLPGAPPNRQAAKRSGLVVPGSLGRLYASAAEVRAIAALFPPDRTRVYLAEDAVERRLDDASEVARARYLHFATHGLVDATEPAHSALLLSPDDDGNDGLLQAFEIVALDLSAELVTLSACETGLGRLYRGEGLLGLSRAFVYAGAERLLASLWRVADTSTGELMTSFYRQLQLNPDSPAAALRRAKLEMLERPDRAHPYAWAGFVLLGR